MKTSLISALVFASFMAPIAANATAEHCSGAQKNYRAFVETGAKPVEDGITYLISPKTTDALDCDGLQFSTIDVDQEGRGFTTQFDFENKKECLKVLRAAQRATPELPIVIVIDKMSCKAHLAI